MRGVERMRKLLSTMHEAKVQVENLADDADVSLTMTRAELADLVEFRCGSAAS